MRVSDILHAPYVKMKKIKMTTSPRCRLRLPGIIGHEGVTSFSIQKKIRTRFMKQTQTPSYHSQRRSPEAQQPISQPRDEQGRLRPQLHVHLIINHLFLNLMLKEGRDEPNMVVRKAMPPGATVFPHRTPASPSENLLNCIRDALVLGP